MCKLVKSNLLCLLLFACSSGIALSQTTDSKKLKEYKENPHWVKMMEDSTVNYFEAVQAFDVFWKERKVPVEDDVIVDGKEEKKEKWTTLRKILHNKEYKEEKESEEYRFEHKKFVHWQLTVEPYVQPDGRILSPEEQLEIWKTQRK